ncbi:hypothetical protein ACE34R_000558 [Vibrio cholerae]|uniref:hypothetical protein n=1 Tax=Vibrio parahaemolyticus TaxID=670 RepID=UPI00063E8550|nr:hypothetical protein [Vibrio parahaemolyticus]EGR1279207.1 hypothetical protein [Vibrio cholerae]HDV0904598.1 hypothetical protein [Vibrio fluvialis]EGR3365367.1 hypothetical protein [Vibrio parahaemolyticus]EHC9834990.1 hypothetical protein [Vibrio cholerae]EJK2411591.1 hypothetical protein [Vibrio parahaemolyticus]
MESVDWVSLAGVVATIVIGVATIVIGVIQVIKSKSSSDINVNQSSGWFSKTKQQVNVGKKKNGKR